MRLDHVRRGPVLRPYPQPEGHVLEDAHVAEERVVLEDEADAAMAHVAHRRVFAFEQHLAAVGLLQARDDAQEAGLARARRAEQGHELAGGDVEAHVVHRHERAERLGDAVTSMDIRVLRRAAELRRSPLHRALGDEGHEGQEGQERRDRERGLEVVFVVEDLHVQGQGVGPPADVAGDHRDRAELAHRARVAQDDPVEQAPLDVGKVTARRSANPKPPGPRAASSSRCPRPASSGISSRATKGKVTKIVARIDAGDREHDLEVVGLDPRARGCPGGRRGG